jgi:hypothetical protein
MKIYSNFKDYYDSVGVWDTDPLPVFNRQTIEWDMEDYTSQQTRLIKSFFPKDWKMPEPLPTKGIIFDHRSYSSVHQRGVVAFCGKLYPFYQVYVGGNVGYKYCYTFDQYVDAIKLEDARYLKAALNSLETNTFISREFGGSQKYHSSEFFNRKTWDKFIKTTNFDVPVEKFREVGSPILLLDGTINPQLNKLNFQSVIDPYTAYQNLSMYLGNDMVDLSSSDPKPITDKMRAETKGFDDWSFRRHKTEDSKFVKRNSK